MNDFPVPVVALGPGSQTDPDEERLDYLPMPHEMTTFRMPELPEVEDFHDRPRARSALMEIRDTLAAWRPGDPALVVHLDDLDERDLRLVDQVLGEGEVSIRCDGPDRLRVQESVLTGVWRVQALDRDGRTCAHTVEVGDIPRGARARAFTEARPQVTLPEQLPQGVLNAPSVVTELNHEAQSFRPGDAPHVVNLTLLPQTPEDLELLEGLLGPGPVEILSRGYGNCRISSTGLRRVWWVRHFNSQDLPILTTLEVADVPVVACAAAEDLQDSHARLTEILGVLQ